MFDLLIDLLIFQAMKEFSYKTYILINFYKITTKESCQR